MHADLKIHKGACSIFFILMKYSYNGKSDELKTFFLAALKISVFPSKISFAYKCSL